MLQVVVVVVAVLVVVGVAVILVIIAADVVMVVAVCDGAARDVAIGVANVVGRFIVADVVKDYVIITYVH